jgi:hypothetical protein
LRFASAKVELFSELCKHFTKKKRKNLFFPSFAFNFSLLAFHFSIFVVPLHRFSKPFLVASAPRRALNARFG